MEKRKKSLVLNTGNKMQNLTQPIPIQQSCRKCTECFKWEIRLQERMKTVCLLTEETIKPTQREKSFRTSEKPYGNCSMKCMN